MTYETTPGDNHTPHYVTGRIAQLRLPTGGSVNFAYSGGTNGFDCTSVPILTRTVKDSAGNTVATTIFDGQSMAPKVLVTDPMGNDTVYNFLQVSASPAGANQGFPTQIVTYSGSHTGTPLQTQVICYNGNTTNCPTIYQSVGEITERDVYVTPFGMSTPAITKTLFDQWGDTTDIKQYGYDGSLLRHQFIAYGTDTTGTGSCAPGPFIDRVCTVEVDDGSAAPHMSSWTSYSYDTHGNRTATNQYTGTSHSADLHSSATYNSTNGTLTTATAANGAVTTYAYDGTGGCNGLLPTSAKVTGAGLPPGGLITYTQWDCNGGVVTQTTDANGAVTYDNFVVNGIADPLYRMKSVADVLGNTTTFTYTPTSFDSAMVFNSGASTTETVTEADSLGRKSLVQRRQGASSLNYDTVAYGYDGNGRINSTSMPCVAALNGTCTTPVTTQTYDGMGRPLVSTDGGQGTTTKTYPKNDILSVVGPAPTGVEHTKSHQYEYDALGRLTSACEILASGGSSCNQSSTASGYATSYVYTVPLAGGSQVVVTQGVQTRTYVYDALGRLISESNPETGTTTYVYDSSGADSCSSTARTSPGDLLRRTDANGNYVCYVYDALRRPTDVKNNLDNATNPCRRFRYDNSTGVLGSIPTGISVLNTMGRMVEAETDTCASPITQASIITDEWLSYTARGENSDLYESTLHSGGYYHTTALYFANGSLQSVSGVPGYPGISYGVDGEGRLVTAQQGTTKLVCDSSCSTTGSTTFNAASQPLTINIGGTGTNGSGDNDTYTYDPNTGRMSTYMFTVGSTPKSIAGTLTWNQNGTLRTLAIVDGFNPGGSQTCNYGSSTVMGYDDLGRLLSANCGSVWQQTFSYDQYGNITKSGSSSWACAACYDVSKNRYNSVLSATIAYDSAGNLLNDTFHTYQWDVYGHSAKIGPPTGLGSCGATGTTCVTYDANGRTVETQTGAAYSQILYSPVGKTAIMNGQVTQNQYASLPGGATAYLSGSTGSIRYFWHKDWLGTARFASGIVSRTLYYDRAFAPFGEMYDNFGNSSGLDFTGDTQDTVSGTFDTPNREQNPSQGRWISPDPAGLSAADFNNPQTLNRYSYVANYPLTMTDPTGMDMSGPWGYDTYDPGAFGSSHSGPGSLLEAFVAAVEAVRDGMSLPSAGERYDTAELSPFEYQGGSQTFTTWAAAAAFVQAQNQDASKWKHEVEAAIAFDKDARAAYQQFGPTAKTIDELEKSVDKSLEKKWGPIGVAGSTSTSGDVQIKPDPNPYRREATVRHEAVHHQTALEGIAKYGKDTPAFLNWWNNPGRWAADEVKAYSAGINYLEESLRKMSDSP